MLWGQINPSDRRPSEPVIGRGSRQDSRLQLGQTEAESANTSREQAVYNGIRPPAELLVLNVFRHRSMYLLIIPMDIWAAL